MMLLHDKIAEFEARRKAYGPLPGGIAPATCSSEFKAADLYIDSEGGRVKAKAKAKATAIRHAHRFSLEAQARKSSTLRAAASSRKPASEISLGVARPTSQAFPWKSIYMSEEIVTAHEGGVLPDPSKLMSCVEGEHNYDLGIALNYGLSMGSPQLLRFLTEHVELVHNPPYRDWECTVTAGTTAALDTVLRMLCDRGDSLLTEQYTYAGALEAARPMGLNIVGVKMDYEGLIPDELDQILTDWDKDQSGAKKPRVLYTIPSGHNPTSTTQSTARRKAVYAVAERHDLCIIDDDPYYFLQLENCVDAAEQQAGSAADAADAYLKALPASYLSIDTSGRVIHLDSTSKILSPGLRCGWMTACAELVEKFTNFVDFSTTGASGVSQVMLYKLLDERWGHRGLLSWLNDLSVQYRDRRNVMLAACDEHMPKAVCEWIVPIVGMFVWIRVGWRKHPMCPANMDINEVPAFIAKTEASIHLKAKERGVQISRGSWFAVDSSNTATKELCFRLTFAATSESLFEHAIAAVGTCVREEFKFESAPASTCPTAEVATESERVAVHTVSTVESIA